MIIHSQGVYEEPFCRRVQYSHYTGIITNTPEVRSSSTNMKNLWLHSGQLWKLEDVWALQDCFLSPITTTTILSILSCATKRKVWTPREIETISLNKILFITIFTMIGSIVGDIPFRRKKRGGRVVNLD